MTLTGLMGTLSIVLLDFPQTSSLELAKRGKLLLYLCHCSPPVPPQRLHQRTFRSVLRTQMKVQTDGLLLDLRTTNPPGPFSPLKAAPAERERRSQRSAASPAGWMKVGGGAQT